jgi:hypothetical protein
MVAVARANVLIHLPYHALMATASRRLGNPYPLLILGGGTLLTVAALVVHSAAFAANADILAWAFTFDLALSVPLLWWWFAVRTGRAASVTMIPIFLLGVAAAARIIPPAQHAFVDQLRSIAAPLDLLAIALVLRRVAKLRGLTGEGDVLDRIDRACAGIFGPGRAARIVAFEIATFYYAFFGWRRDAPPGFTVHRRNGWGLVVTVLIFLIGVESVAAHLVVQLWSVKAAWILTTLDLYGILWFLGDYQALRLRPIQIERDALMVNYGLRWRMTIPFSSIEAIEPARAERDWKRKGVLKVAMLDEPRLLVRLRVPQTAFGLAGLTRTIDTLAILADDDTAFETMLRAAMPEPRPAATS